jgi:integrase
LLVKKQTDTLFMKSLEDTEQVGERSTEPTRVSHWLRDRERDGLVGAGTTLHGLRVSYAAWWKRTGGANNAEIADLLGDKSERMGAHYTRHVDAESNVTRAFSRLKDGS